jgi:transcription termination factor Rho
MDLDNQDTPTEQPAEATAPRKRASRRVISTEVAAVSTEAPSAPETASNNASSQQAQPAAEQEASDKPERPRRKRPTSKKADESVALAGDDASSSDSSAEDAGDSGDAGDDANGFNRGRGRGRGRDRRRGRGSFGEDGDQEISDDDVLIPIGGILDVLDNYAFVRTQGYLPGPTDVYVSLGQVKKYNLRKGDAVIGAIRQPREGDNQGRQKYNALVSVDSINGQTIEEAASRVEFSNLTAVYPTERLQMETTSDALGGRMVDIFTPVGKGQRGVIIGAPKTGKSELLFGMANAIAQNAPDAHLMVVLIDEHPEAITDMQRQAKGEVISSTFDRSSDDHTTIAELAVERAKRLVELGHDVVVLMDSVTRLARAYQQNISGGGRSAASDAAWVYPTKKLFGAARNVENGGSLTIIGTLVTDTGLHVDDLVASEVAGAATMELHLNHHAAAARMYPAVDIARSGTRRDDQLVSHSEATVVADLRRGLAEAQPEVALRSVLDGMKTSASNVEFLVAMPKKLSTLSL